MKLKIAGLLAMSALSAAAGMAQAANSHLGVIPVENVFDVSFERAGGNVVTRTLREGGIVTVTQSSANSCMLLSRAFVITDAQLGVIFQTASPLNFHPPMIYTVNGANLPIKLVQGSPDAADPGETTLYHQNFTAGVMMPAGSYICANGGTASEYTWVDGRVAGYYPSK